MKLLFIWILLEVFAAAFPQSNRLGGSRNNARKNDHRQLQLLPVVASDDELINRIKADILQLILQTPTHAPKFLRLVFHNCVGGCNGCVDMANPENAGLEIPIQALQPIVQKYRGQISRADIWALAGIYATEISSGRRSPSGGDLTRGGDYDGEKFSFPFEFRGRVDCDYISGAMCVNINNVSSPCSATNDNDHPFPSVDFSTGEVLSYFADMFNFSTQETVALFGAHTIGTALRVHTGFIGRGWTNDFLRLDNQYYKDIVGGNSPNTPNVTALADAPDWSLVFTNNSDLPGVPDRYFWVRGEAETGVLIGARNFMLNSDIALVRDFSQHIDTEGKVSCDFSPQKPKSVCPNAMSTIRKAAEYRLDNGLWLRDFRNVLTKLSKTGYNNKPMSTVSPVNAPSRIQSDRPTVSPDVLVFCFSEKNTVQLENGQNLPIHNLSIGDKVLVHDGSYKSVYSFGHRNPAASGNFLRLATHSNTLELSADHMLLINNKFIPASMVSLGDRMSNGEIVTSIRAVKAKGLYAPFTTSGTIVVSGIVSSSYVTLQKDSPNVMIGNIDTSVSWQWVAYSFETPHRLFAAFGETYTDQGVSNWVNTAYMVGKVVLQKPFVLQLIFALLVFFLLVLFHLLEWVCFAVGIVVLWRTSCFGRLQKKVFKGC